jgi:membrane-associated phospholipid phosphatase
MLVIILLVLTVSGLLLGVAIAADKDLLFAKGADAVQTWSDRHAGGTRRILKSKFGAYLIEFPAVAMFGILLIAALWALLALLEDVVMGDGIVGLDRVAYAYLQALRDPFFDRLLVGVTELGDAKVAVPVFLSAMALFIFLRRWREAAVYALALAGASLFVAGLKDVIHRARPMDIYDGVAEYSFPSGHAGMSIVIYGMLAFLLACRAPSAWKRTIYGFTIPFIFLIGFSRLYLGAHWLSDVLAGLAFGLAWNSALAVLYLSRAPDPWPTRLVTPIIAVILVLAGSVHIARDYEKELLRYSELPVVAPQPKRGPP